MTIHGPGPNPIPATAAGGAEAALTSFQEEVLHWGRQAFRDLPWRRTRNPWAILVSELMLQQTPVSRVVPRWSVFLAHFPTAAACAAAPAGEVVREWAGLGYNRRAVNLHRAATAVVDRHAGSVPEDLAALLDLPGVGPYTARAVQAFAFGIDVGLVEVNSARVLARAAAGRSLTAAEAQIRADALVPSGRAWEWNQAVMDLGSVVCRRRVPACAACPVASTCAWSRSGHPPPDPADGSAGAGARQSVFAGSDRQGRGCIVTALRNGPVPAGALAAVAGWPSDPARARRAADALVTEGLARWRGPVLIL